MLKETSIEKDYELIFKGTHTVELLILENHPMMIHQKGMDFNRDFYVIVGNQCRTWVTNTISLYKLINALLLFIGFK